MRMEPSTTQMERVSVFTPVVSIIIRPFSRVMRRSDLSSCGILGVSLAPDMGAGVGFVSTIVVFGEMGLFTVHF